MRAICRHSCFILSAVVWLLPAWSWAQEGPIERVLGEGAGLAPQGVSQPLVLILILIGLVLLPIIAMMTTSFVKITVVLSMLRNAIGTQQIPPTPIITGLALIMTIYIMTPVGMEMYRATEGTIKQGTNQPLLSQASMDLILKGITEAKEPMRAFLAKHSHKKEQKLFYGLGLRMMLARAASEKAATEVVAEIEGISDEELVPKEGEAEESTDPTKSLKPNDFMVLIPAFVISELTEAFQIAFIIFLPFLVIDIVVTNILLALGMFMVPPITISLPFKLLLFVVIDGWHILSRALLMGYM